MKTPRAWLVARLGRAGYRPWRYWLMTTLQTARELADLMAKAEALSPGAKHLLLALADTEGEQHG